MREAMRHSLAIFGENPIFCTTIVHVMRLGWLKTHSGCIAHRFGLARLLLTFLALTGGFPLVATDPHKALSPCPIPPLPAWNCWKPPLAVCRDGGIRYVNPACENLLALSQKELLRHTLSSLFVDSRALVAGLRAAVTHDVSFTEHDPH